MSPAERPARYVLITGTSSGIGRASALRLARAGFHVLAGVRCDADALAVEEAGRDATEGVARGSLQAVQLDVTDAASVAAAVERVRLLCGYAGLAGLVNNAGICVVGPAECVPLAQWRRQFEVNFFGAIAVTQAMLPLLRTHAAAARTARWSARIINVSSVTGQVASPLFGAYSASKFALEALSDAMRLELRAQRIGLSLINPGTIQSEIWRKEKEGVAALADGSLARQLYGPMIDNVARFVFRAADKAIPADRVAAAVQRCLTRRRPPTRLRIGWEAQLGYRAKNLLPGRVFDFLMCRTLGVPRR
jgi:NAD(P)-dependent dehydrogenase (short-subunit alcohol dehydrogenase family)